MSVSINLRVHHELDSLLVISHIQPPSVLSFVVAVGRCPASQSWFVLEDYGHGCPFLSYLLYVEGVDVSVVLVSSVYRLHRLKITTKMKRSSPNYKLVQ